MLEDNDAPGRMRLRGPRLQHFALGVERVADEHRLGELDLFEAEIADRGAEREIADREPYCEAEREDRIYQALTELGLFAELGVQMQRLHVHRERGDQQVVGLGYGAPGLMLEGLADFEFLEVFAHRSRSQRRMCASIAGAARRRRPAS